MGRKISEPLRVLHLILVLRSTNGQYNEHALPVAEEREITLCTYFEPQLTPPPTISVFAGDGSLRGFFKALKNALDGEEYDAIQAHTPHVAVLLVIGLAMWGLWGKLRRQTVFLVNDSYYDFKLRNKVLLFLTLTSFYNVVFCSRAALESFPRSWLRVAGSRTRVIRNGADVDRIDGVLAGLETQREGPFTLLSIGRLEPVKDPMTMLEAFEQVAGDDVRLVWVGDGSLRSDLEDEIRTRGLADLVTLTGQMERDEVFEWCLAADLFISTSRGEGLPVAVMEAMICRLPVVLSDIGPHREFDGDPEVISLVSVGDAGGFAEKISRIQSLIVGERRAIGERCRSIVVEGFSLSGMTEEYGRLYQDLRRHRESD